MATIIELFEESVRTFETNPYVYQKENGSFRPYTYSEVHARVEKFAAGMLALGLDEGDRVSLLSEGQLDWICAELGILYCAAINVPLSIKLNEPSELIFRLKHSESRFIVVSSTQLVKVRGFKDELPKLEKIIVIGTADENDRGVISFDEVLQLGAAFLTVTPQKLVEQKSKVTNNTYANICYTSGTTADPKGIILTHRNYTANVDQASALFYIPEWYTTLLILPWDHAFAHTVGLYILMKYGASLACVEVGKTPMETLKNIPINIKESKPVFLLSVPALAKNFRKNIEKSIQDSGKVAVTLFTIGLKIAYKYHGNGWNRGGGLRILLKPLVGLFDTILFKKIRAGFGGRLEFFSGGGALLDTELQRFFCAIGMPMLQGYGLSEASPVISSNTREVHKFGTSGILVPDMDLKICDDDGNELPKGEKGEIVIKGENVMAGYWRNDQATKETIKDGWLYTGDMGYMDPDGFLMVLGRFKSLLIADDGEKFSPEGIEEALADNSSLIEQCMLYNNQKPYTVCLLALNKEQVKKAAANAGFNSSSPNDYPAILKLIEDEINQYRTGGKFADMFPQRWLPVATAILPEGFTEQNQFLNSTLKMVRPKITEHYADLIDYLYVPEAKNIANNRNLEVLNQLFT